MCLQYDATTAKILSMSPYAFFSSIGVVVASSLFMLLLWKFGYNIIRYTRIFLLSSIGLFIGAKTFGFLTVLYRALAGHEQITLSTLANTGIVFYGGLVGFILSFLLICKVWNKRIDHGAVDLAVVCIPLFHFFGRLGCFFSGCCFGIENHSRISVLYTTSIRGEISTVSRLPIQLIEAGLNVLIFVTLLVFLFKHKLRKRFLVAYLFMYAALRITLEFFRGDSLRGVWRGVSFSQVVSVVILISCIIVTLKTSKSKPSKMEA